MVASAANPANEANEADETVRCSVWTREADLTPAGSADSVRGFLLVDVALPWPGDVGASEDLRDVKPIASWEHLRLQATVPERGAPRRVALYRPAEGAGFTRFEGRELTVDEPGPEALAAAVRSLVDGGGAEVVDGEVLVCTHGARDACCGSFGTTLFMELQAAAGESPRTPATGHSPVATGPVVHGVGGRRIRRTSHTGGHRFAPTAIVLPEGSAWAWADLSLLTAVADNQGPIGAVVVHYRGCAGLPSSGAQAMEVALLSHYGWDLFAASRRAEDLGGGRHRVHVEKPDGVTEVWEAEVTRGQSVEVPVCGQPTGNGTKRARDLVVTGLVQVL